MHDATIERDHRRCFAPTTTCAGYVVRDLKGRTLGRVRDAHVNEAYEPE